MGEVNQGVIDAQAEISRLRRKIEEDMQELRRQISAAPFSAVDAELKKRVADRYAEIDRINSWIEAHDY